MNDGNRYSNQNYRAGDPDAHRDDRDMAFGNRQDSQSFKQNNSSKHWDNDRYDRDRSTAQSWRNPQQWEPYRSQGDSYGQRNERYGMDYRSTQKDEYQGRSNLGTDYRNLESDYENRGWNDDANTTSRYGRSYYSNQQSDVSHYGRGPKNYRRSDDRIREDVSEALERDHAIDASEIEVEVKEGIVTLRGHAEDRRQKRMAEDCIEHLPGVKDVRNELTINQSLFQRAKEALLGSQISENPNESRVGEKKSSKH